MDKRQCSFVSRITLILLVLGLLITMIPQPTNALIINGTGSGITDNAGVIDGGFQILSEDRAFGYRISIVDSTGKRYGTSYDVYSEQTYREKIGTSSSTQSMFIKDRRNKMEYKDIYAGVLSGDVSLETEQVYDSDFFAADYRIKDSDWGLTFPVNSSTGYHTADKLPGWLNEDRIDTIASKGWGLSYNYLKENGYNMVFELLCYANIRNNWMGVTVSELAILAVVMDASGSPYYDQVSDYWYHKDQNMNILDYSPPTGSKTSYPNTWHLIVNYTHGNWPYSLRLTSDIYNLKGENLRYLGGSYRLDHGTARELLECGYGMLVVFDGYKGYKVTYDGNGATGGSTADSGHEFDVPKNLNANGYTRTGYSFVGWGTTKTGGTIYGATTNGVQSVTNLTSTPYATVTLYAQWKQNAGKIRVVKTTNTGENISKWRFGIYTDSACTKQVEIITSGDNGTVTSSDLAPGTYYVKELDRGSAGGYLSWNVDYSVKTVTVTAGKTTDVNIRNNNYGRIKGIVKTNTGSNLSGWQIGVYTDAACTKPITGSPFTTDANGYIYTTVDGKDGTKYLALEPGTTYYVKQIGHVNGTAGWTMDTSVGSAKITASGTAEVTFTNNLNYYYLDLNGVLDGSTNGGLGSFGTADVYINGTLVANDVTDYYTQWPYGTTYEIKDIKSTTGHSYIGLASGSAALSGTLTSAKSVVLSLNTNYAWIYYHPNGGTISTSYTQNTYGWIQSGGTIQFQRVFYGNTAAPYAATTFGLARRGYTFGGWILNDSSTVLTAGTQYNSSVYAHHADSSKTTANTSVVEAYLKAKWNPTQYTIYYHGNGGSGSMSSHTVNYDATTSIKANGFTYAGHDFVGWTTKSDGTDDGYNWTDWSGTWQYINGEYGVSNNELHLYARWSKKTYTNTIYHYLRDPYAETWTRNTTTTFNGTFGNSVTIPANHVQTYTGFYNDGWAGSYWGTSTWGSKQIGTSFTQPASALGIEYYYYPSTYTVTYDANGGTGAPSAQNFYMNGIGLSKVAYYSSTTPTRTGYTFSGWVCKENSVSITAGQAIPDGWGSHTLVAQWTPNIYTITCDKQSGTGGTTTFYEKYATGFYSNSSATTAITKITVPTRTGYSFQGYYTQTGGKGTQIVDKDGKIVAGNTYFTSNATIYAYWTPNIYTITLDRQNGSGGPDAIYEKYGVNYYYDSSAAAILTKIVTPTRTGYTFQGYYTQTGGSGDKIIDKDGNIVAGNTYFTSNATIYAYWTPNTYTITCDKQSGTGGTDKFYEIFDTKFYVNTSTQASVTSITTPTRVGYTFAGYYSQTGGKGDKIVDANGKIVVANNYFSKDTTIYAHWTPNTYTITLDKQNGTGGTNVFYEVYATKFYVNTSTQASATSVTPPTRDGYTFQGYYTQTGGKGDKIIAANGNIQVANTYFTSNATLYAYWTVNYDVALEDIIFFSELDPDKEMTAQELTEVLYGTRVYVSYKYRNNTVIDVAVTGYDFDGNAISHNGSTSYTIAAGDTLTVQGGSFIATPLGPGSVSGTVYMAGYSNADHEYNDDLTGNAAKNNNTRTESYTVKHDLFVSNVYVTHGSATGNIVSMDALVVGETYYIHHVYGNNSYADVTVYGYHNGSTISVNGSVALTIPARSTVDIIAYTYKPTEVGKVEHAASLYRAGLTSATEPYEITLANNVMNYALDTIPIPSLEIIEQNAAYRAKTEVITSYWLHNNTSRPYPTGDHVVVRMRVYDSVSGNLLTTLTQNVVVPANEDQLVYFRWTVPEIARYNHLDIIADIQLPWIGMNEDTWLSKVSGDYRYSSWSDYFTPDTEYEEKAPGAWTLPTTPVKVTSSMTWYQWTCNTSGTFTKVNYGITASPGTATLTPDSKTAFKDSSGVWHMKSGYGFFMNITDPVISAVPGYTMPSSGAYTSVQYSYIAYPEFQYSTANDRIDTVEEVSSGNWQLCEFMDYGRKHHTPIWFPDGHYIVRVYQTDIWTPMGMLMISSPSQDFIIEGDMYDDWYISHG